MILGTGRDRTDDLSGLGLFPENQKCINTFGYQFPWYNAYYAKDCPWFTPPW